MSTIRSKRYSVITVWIYVRNALRMLQLSGQALTIKEIHAVASGACNAGFSETAIERMVASRAVIEKLLRQNRVVYGVNTGFGKLADVHVPADKIESLQVNLVRSHSTGLGKPLSIAETRAMMVLRANVFALGYSGCRVELAVTLLQMLEKGVYPRIPEKGSVGASGDLAPLAHLALSVIGEGESWYDGQWRPGGEALAASGIKPVKLAGKEGLALLNGTQAMCAVGGLALYRAQRVTALADLAGAMTLEALLGTPVALDARIHKARPHPGQQAAAAHLRTLLEGSEIRLSHVLNDPRVQDAYCLRCMPQVHGAVRGALQHVQSVIEIESGSATDNPLIFADAGEVLSGGNFHGAPVAFACDYAAIVMTDLISIAERRIDRLINPDLNEGLPPFLSADPGTSSGFMMVHVCAAALLNEAKVLAHPASTDSVPTSGGKEDHVSMGMTCALKFRQIVENAEYVSAIELIVACEGLDYRSPLKSSGPIEKARSLVRSIVPRLTADRPPAPGIEALAEAIRQGLLDEFMELPA
jgi:histidine ammonia-lyase